MTKKVLFLDIDGVLHPTGAVSQLPDGTISKIDAFRWEKHLQQCLADFPEVTVIVHSTWRLMYETDDELRAQLSPYLASRMTASTPRSHMSRHNSIVAYCEEHQITQFVIVDDEPAAFPLGLPNLVVCDGLNGLSDENTEAELWRALRDMIGTTYQNYLTPH